MKYHLCEIFYSIQGEGLLQGIPMIFIRLAGCNIRCTFCDTKYAWEKDKEIDLRKIIKEIERYPAEQVCITGGEPFLQNLIPLVDSLKKKKYWIAVETNGAIWQDVKPDWTTVSPKREGLKFFRYGYDERFLKIADEFKYVITRMRDMEFIDHRIEVPVVLQPVDNNLKIANQILKILKKHPENNWCFRMQMHKILGIK